MSISYNNLTIRGRDGRRVPVTDCNLEPLNLLIPGGAPILVPKRAAWRPPRTSNNSNAAVVGNEVPSVDYDAEGEDEGDKSQAISKKRSSSRGRSRSKGRGKGKGKSKERCRKASHVKDKAREAKHRRHAELLLHQSEHAREKADERRERLARRIEEQEAYVARLKAKYEARASDEKKKKKNKASTVKSSTNKKARVDASDVSASAATTEAATTSNSEGDVTTDGSADVREMLKNMKIRAAGTEGFGTRDTVSFSSSEDAQLLLHKGKNNETWKFIADAMGRGKDELKKRYKVLNASNATIPGEGIDIDNGGDKGGAASSDAATAGDETTDAEKTGEETTDAEKTENESKDDSADDAFLGGAMGALEAAVEAEAAKEATKSPEKQKGGSPAKSGKPNNNEKKNKKQQQQKKSSSTKAQGDSKGEGGKKQKSPTKPRSEAAAGGESGYDASASEAIDDAGTKAYIGQYATQLLAEANAGLVKMPETDDNFDEDDCILLALADSYRRKNRWLDIQSDFANTTGRLVPEEVLKWKLDEGEKPEGC